MTRVACALISLNWTLLYKPRWRVFGSKSIRITSNRLADFDGYRQEFLQLFGFGVEGVDYAADVDPNVAILAAGGVRCSHTAQ